ncbi:HEAT repeat domain-containing protein [Microcoleus vaginatus GB1-A2]|uniref:HEAT repeat domain-containing protein n=1 Tax=Microcoleus vaginatus TaxID=119532 RepID=UPI0016896834|nr:HEAT repeat domain-containing protein [Microcoleus sp. FACHB-61]
MATPVDFPKYLQSLVESYKKQQHLYTLTDLQVEVEVEIPPEDRSQLPSSKKKPETKIERLEVLAGLRKYVQQGNVLLVGKPGSGKSTVLQRFRWELALEALKEGDRPIPVLVQLRSDRSILEAICAEFRQGKLRVSSEDVDDLLLDRKLLLLLDGVNEMPSQKRRQELQLFREENSDTPMIFTTRDLALGGSLGIEQQLEMCALTQPQMREFVHKHLPQHGDLLLGQLRDRLPEVAETPLLLKMMCEVFENTGEIPQSKGELFQKFDRQYDEFKGVPSVSEDFRRFKSDLLQQLAFVMFQGDSQRPTDGWVAISRRKAEGILKCWLRDEEEQEPLKKAKKWLEDLRKHHLLQVAAKPEEIEFHHQLFQEYYAGRALLKLFDEKHPDAIDNERLQHFYLNYFKWTEPLAFMLSLLRDQVQAVRVVRLALDVDLMLGARLAGEVQREFQQCTVGLVDGLDVPGWLKVELLGEARSDEAIPRLLELVEDSDSDVRWRVADALGNIGSEVAISRLLELVEHSDSDVRWSVADALGNIGSEVAISRLLKLVEDSDYDVRWSVADSLGKIGDQAAIEGWLKLVKDSNYSLRSRAADALGKMGNKAAIKGLLKLVKHSDYDVRWSAAEALGKMGNKAAIERFLKLVENSDSDVRRRAANTLGNIADKTAIEGLLKLLENSDSDVRSSAADALGNIGDKAAIKGLLKLLEDSDSDVRWSAADALGNIGDKAAIKGLLKVLVEDSDSDVRSSAANALGKICDKAEIEELLKLVKHSDYDVRTSVAEALGKIGGQAAIKRLLELVKDSYYYVRGKAAEALGKIGNKAAIDGLLELVKDSNYDVRWRAAEALGKIGDEVAIPGLLKLVKDSDYYTRGKAAEALGKIGDEAAIKGLLKLLEDSNSGVRWSAADALGNIAKHHTEKVALHLPHLLNLIPSASGKEVHRAILAIQTACKYYNYEIRQLRLAPHPAKPPQPKDLLAKIDETTQQIHKTTKEMSDKPTQDFSNSSFYAPFNFGDNHANQAQNITFTTQQSSPEAALNAVVQIIQALEKKYTNVQDEQQARKIIDAEFKVIKEQKPIEWQNLISLKRLYNGGKKAAVKVGEHFTESNPWGKGLVAFIEGVSEDVN